MDCPYGEDEENCDSKRTLVPSKSHNEHATPTSAQLNHSELPPQIGSDVLSKIPKVKARVAKIFKGTGMIAKEAIDWAMKLFGLS